MYEHQGKTTRIPQIAEEKKYIKVAFQPSAVPGSYFFLNHL